jgi:AraC-like DNA-binding protein
MPQAPSLQTPEQQSAPPSHGSPSRVQFSTPHVPCVHVPAQQPAPFTHDAPSGAHVPGPHVPLWQMPWQQSSDVAQPPPCGPHEASLHTPPAHAPSQHAASDRHAAPGGSQLPPQTPPLQTLEQQSLASEHESPGRRHSARQAPFVHASPRQHPSAHPSPAALHTVQTWLSHVPLQHSENASQASPPGLHSPLPLSPLEPGPLPPSSPQAAIAMNPKTESPESTIHRLIASPRSTSTEAAGARPLILSARPPLGPARATRPSAMLFASARFDLGGGWMRSRFLLGDALLLHIVERRRLVFDGRFVPPARGRSQAWVLLVALEGRLELLAPEARVLDAPAALLLPEEVVEGAEGERTFAYRAVGEPYAGIDLRFGPHHAAAARAGDVACDGPLAAASRALLAAGSDAATIEAARAFFDALVTRGVLAPSVQSALPVGGGRFDRVWRGLRPFAERFHVLSTLDEVSLASGSSLRQLARDVDGFRRALGLRGGWRETTRRYRLKLAVIALSCPDATIAEVARAVGYGSVEAMARAFRDAGLPPASVVRAAVRGEVAAASSASHPHATG